MTQAMTQETPLKVLLLTGTALFSLAFMFAVSATDASFSGTRQALPDPFASASVVAAVDQAAAGYSQFLTANFIEPVASQYSVYADNIAWISQEVSSPHAAQGLAAVPVNAAEGQVAGDFVNKADQADNVGFGIDQLYSLLIR